MIRTKLMGLFTGVILVGCQMSICAAETSKFDGSWHGARLDVSGSSICKKTDISGEINNGYVKIKLLYNNTMLTGQLDSDGAVNLDNNHARWDYVFSGKAAGNRIEGDWSIGNAPCRGSWFVERQ